MITNLQGTFLSNFYERQFIWNNSPFRNAESAFQQAKCKNANDYSKFYDLTGRQAKALGKRIEMREDWNDIKLGVMKQIVTMKFICNPDLMHMLWHTGEQEIIEGNTWNDTYWGVCNGIGSNHLGKILMEIRSSYPVKVTG